MSRVQNMKTSFVDDIGVMIWSYYYFGKYSAVFGEIIISTYDGRGKLYWFVLMHDPLFYLFGDMPIDHVSGWLVEYPRGEC